MFIDRYIKNYNIQIIKYKFVFIYLLNVTDIIFTFFLLGTGMFYEGNAVIRGVINNKSLSLSLKAIIPLLLLIYLYIRIQKASEKQLFYSNIIINVCLIFYIMLNISHIVWTGFYLVMR